MKNNNKNKNIFAIRYFDTPSKVKFTNLQKGDSVKKSKKLTGEQAAEKEAVQAKKKADLKRYSVATFKVVVALSMLAGALDLAGYIDLTHYGKIYAAVVVFGLGTWTLIENIRYTE